MVGMETLRCPTCVTLLPDPDALRCPACKTKLRKRRRRPIVLGESNRLSERSLPVDVELRVRAEHRYESFVSKAKVEAEPRDAVLAFAPTETAAPVPTPEPEPLEVAPLASEPLVLEPDVQEPDVPEPPVPEVVTLEPDPREPAPREPAPMLDTIDLTTEPDPRSIDLTTEPEPDPSVTSGWQAVPPRSTPASPLDGTLNEMVEELHRKAREDLGTRRTR